LALAGVRAGGGSEVLSSEYAGDVTILGDLAIILQGLGLAVTAAGLRYTWRECHEPGDRFLDPVIRALRRLDPRRRRDRTVLAGVADGVGVADDASVQVTFGPLPANDRDAIDILAQQIQGLRSNFETTTTDIRRNAGEVARRVAGLEGRVAAEVERLERADRHVATDGLRLESIGLLIIAAGTVVQLLDGLTR
jgi:hypothetical protein